MTFNSKPSVVAELAAVVLTASLVLAIGADAAPLSDAMQKQESHCPNGKAELKLMSMPRMISPAQFCPVPSKQATSKSLKSCWDNFVKNPDSFRHAPQACSARPAPEDDIAAGERSSTIPADLFHFLSTASR